jgi:hypothetical protein
MKHKPIDVTKSKEISVLLRYAEKKKKLTSDVSSVKITHNPLFGKGFELNMNSVINVLKMKDITVKQLKQQIEELQERNQALETELRSYGVQLLERNYVKESSDRYY